MLIADINVLWKIVKLAEASNETPYRALFSAYNTILEQHGIDKNKDQIYFRFLLRMRRDRTTDSSLRAQFQTLLRDHGVQVDFYQPDEDEERPKNDDEETTMQSEETDRTRPQVSTPARRASFTSLYDHDRSQVNSDLHHKLPLRPRSQNTAIDIEQRGGKNVRFQSTEQFFSPVRSRRSGQPSREHRSHVTNSNVHSTGLGSEDNARLENAAFPVLDASQYEQRAKALRFHHLAAHACTLFRHWANRASEQQQTANHKVQQAEAVYQNHLKYDSFEQWRSVHADRKRAKETEELFANLEKKAGKARDIFLLTKAFTHWAQCTSDEVARTSAARRHILRTRYFNAWRDITVVNELKVRRTRLLKFFETWRSKSALIRQQLDTAYSAYETRLTKSSYRQWFWNFCDRRAPIWYGAKLRIQFFERWKRLANRSSVRQAWAEEFSQLKLLRSIFLLWASRSSAISQEKEKALAFRSRWLLRPTIEHLRRQIRLAPLQAQVAKAIDLRLTSTLFQLWSDKARLVLLSEQINETRIMRNAWTTWNDSLRINTLQSTINDRIAVQALYKWVLAERCSLFRRVAVENQKASALNTWRDRSIRMHSRLEAAQQTFEASSRRRLASTIMHRWFDKSHSLTKNTTVAQRARTQHLLAAALHVWSLKSRALASKASEANDAHEYILMRRPLHLWRSKTKSNRKSKRRHAYSAVRSRNHTTLLRGCVDAWRARSERFAENKRIADEVHEGSLMEFGTEIFDSWRARSVVIREQDVQAQEWNYERLLRFAFQAFVRRAQQMQEQQKSATDFASDAQATALAAVFRKMNWHLFQVRRLRETAESLDERNARKRLRAMLRHWADRASQTRGAEVDGPEQTAPRGIVRRYEVAQSINRPSFRALTATRPAQSAIPTPAYLRTPTRRPTRIKGQPETQERIAVPATPATMQITPLVNRMQLQSSWRQPRSSKGEFLRRLTQQRVAEEIPESSVVGE